ncbi:hypothetical protein PCE1_001683 [Barthelona sp. PCE]
MAEKKIFGSMNFNIFCITMLLLSFTTSVHADQLGSCNLGCLSDMDCMGVCDTCSHSTRTCQPKDNTPLLDVYYVKSILMKSNPKFSMLFSSLNAYHGGIVFKSPSGDFGYLCDFLAKSFTGSFIPKLDTGRVEYDFDGYIRTTEKYDWDNWDVKEYVGTIEMSDFVKFVLETVPEMTSDYSWYYLFGTEKHDGGSIWSSHNCQDFVQDAFSRMKGFDAEEFLIKRNFLSFYYDEYEKLDSNDPRILNFYVSLVKHMQALKSGDIGDLFEAIVRDGGDIIVGYPNADMVTDFYLISSVSPYVHFTYEDVDIFGN